MEINTGDEFIWESPNGDWKIEILEVYFGVYGDKKYRVKGCAPNQRQESRIGLTDEFFEREKMKLVKVVRTS